MWQKVALMAIPPPLCCKKGETLVFEDILRTHSTVFRTIVHRAGPPGERRYWLCSN
jgi:hypothetical protein